MCSMTINSRKVLHQIVSSYTDYRDARILINHNRLLNGAHLSALAVEKLLKAAILATGESPARKHLDRADILLMKIDACLPEFSEYINIEFIHYLGRVYKMRYLPDKHHMQISISRNKLLWELDRFFDLMHNVFHFKNEQTKLNTPYYKAKHENATELVENNRWLAGKKDITDLKRNEDYIESIFRMGDAYNLGVNIGKHVPSTFVNCPLGEEIKINIGKE